MMEDIVMHNFEYMNPIHFQNGSKNRRTNLLANFVIQEKLLGNFQIILN